MIRHGSSVLLAVIELADVASQDIGAGWRAATAPPPGAPASAPELTARGDRRLLEIVHNLSGTPDELWLGSKIRNETECWLEHNAANEISFRW